MRRLGGAGIRRGMRGPGAVSEAAWTPAQLSSLEAWYRADDVVLSGSSITTWTDKSANARHLTQGTATAQPTQVTRAGQKAASFDGGDWMRMTAGSTVAQPLTFYFAVEATNVSANYVLFDGDDGTNRILGQSNSGTGILALNAGSTFNSSKQLSAATIHGLAVRFNGATPGTKVWLDDFRASQESSGGAGTNSWDGLTLGANIGPSAHWLGYIWEVIITSAADDATTRALVGDYFSARYSGLTVTT